MRISQNQQSTGAHWERQRRIMASASPLVDCGVHYVDVMAQMAESRPVRVQAMGARLDETLPPGVYNYAQLQVAFADGSVGWYEAGWGPMMSREADFVKDVVGPRGSVTMTATGFARHASALDAAGARVGAEEALPPAPELTLLDLCRAEQEAFARAIREERDLSAHHAAALQSLAVVLAADRSIREGRAIDL